MGGVEYLEISEVLSMMCTMDLRALDLARLRASIQDGFAGRLRCSPRIVRRNERNQRGPGNPALHLRQELALAGFLDVELEVQGGLFHALYFLRLNLHHSHNRMSYADFP